MPISCNAVGDIIALVQLAIYVAQTLSDTRKAPAECRALCNELRALERLIALSRPAIDGLDSDQLRGLVDERLYEVCAAIMAGLELIVDMDTAFDGAGRNESLDRRQRFSRWIRKARQNTTWALKEKASAREARAAIAQCFTTLNYALLVAFQADQRKLMKTLYEAHEESAADVTLTTQRLAAGQDRLHTDIANLNDLFVQLAQSLTRASDEVARDVGHLRNALVETRVDIEVVQRRLRRMEDRTSTAIASSTRTMIDTIRKSGTSTQDTVERLHVTVQRGFAMVQARSGGQPRCDHDELAAWLRSNPLILAFARLLYTGSGQRIENQPREDRIVSRLAHVSREVVSTPSVIAGTFLLALRASSPGERAIYASIAFLLFVSSKTIQLHKTPDIVHVIFVVDMFDVCFEIPLRQADSSENLHRALLDRRRGTFGHALLKQQRYELALVAEDSSTAVSKPMPMRWRKLLQPGDRLSMNALVGSSTSNDIRCPVCSTPCNSEQEHAPSWSWVQCRRCQANYQLISPEESDAAGYAALLDLLNASPSVTDTLDVEDGEVKGAQADALLVQAALRGCRRIRVVETAFDGHVQRNHNRTEPRKDAPSSEDNNQKNDFLRALQFINHLKSRSQSQVYEPFLDSIQLYHAQKSQPSLSKLINTAGELFNNSPDLIEELRGFVSG